MNDELSIGIDLGTTYCYVGIYKNGNVDTIPNEIGLTTTPSIVSFTANERLVGEGAKSQLIKNSENTVYDSKLLIGRKFNDPEIQNNIKFWPFKVIKNPNSNKPLIQVNYKKEKKNFEPEEISAMIIQKMKQMSENYLGYEVNDAVITVPSYFNVSQREATKEAGRIAGLNELRIINESTAAAIAYGLNNNNYERNILVFHLGGRTCDVSILKLDDSVFELISTAFDNHLGGQDFDNQLLKFCIKEFKEYSGIDISNNQKAIRRLKICCESAKKKLSFSDETTIDIDALAEGEDFNIIISCPQFEDLCEELFNECIYLVEKALKESKINKGKINDIILSGGSTRIPKIQNMLSEYFNRKKLHKSINPEEVVAYGAAIQAAKINNLKDDDNLEKLVLLDITPLSLGIELGNGKMDYIIQRNTKIPCKLIKRYKTTKDNQNIIKLRVYEGERLIANKINF